MVQRKRKEKLTAQERRRKAALKGWKTRRANQKRAERDAREERKAIQIEGRKPAKITRLDMAREAVFDRRMELFPGSNEKVVRAGIKMMTEKQLQTAFFASRKQLQRLARDKSNEVDGFNPFWYH